MDDKWLELVTNYEKEFGHLPTWADLMMLQEAEASVALSKEGPRTYVLEHDGTVREAYE